MKNNTRPSLLNYIKKLFTHQHTKVAIYLFLILWLGVGTQFIVNYVFKENFKITDAFKMTGTQERESEIELVGRYREGDIKLTDKEEVIHYIANVIGLDVSDDIEAISENNQSIYYVNKRGKNADSTIKHISTKEEDGLDNDNFIIIRLKIFRNPGSIDHYKKILDKAFDEIGIKEKQFTLEYTGIYKGELLDSQKDEIATNIIGELKGKKAFDYNENDLYMIYGYTGLIDEYILTSGSKINIQIAIKYNESEDVTKVTFGIPIIRSK